MKFILSAMLAFCIAACDKAPTPQRLQQSSPSETKFPPVSSPHSASNNAPNNGTEQTFVAIPLSDSLFSYMQGLSYDKGCPVPRSDLRLLRLRHVTASGEERNGEMVCHRDIAEDLLYIFRELYRAHYPIERISLIDNYAADDDSSMRANNTSCFCYRRVKGSRRLSRHSYGKAVDVNPLFNPYVRHNVIQPSIAKPYADRTKDFPYKITQGDLLHRLFIKRGFTWGGNWRTIKDYQHFEK